MWAAEKGCEYDIDLRSPLDAPSFLEPHHKINCIWETTGAASFCEDSFTETESWDSRNEKLWVLAVGIHRGLRKPKLSAMLSESWHTPGTPLLDCLMCPRQSFGVLCHHKMTPERWSADWEKGPGKLALLLPPGVGDSLVLGSQKSRQLILLPASSQFFCGHMGQSFCLLSCSTFKVKELGT